MKSDNIQHLTPPTVEKREKTHKRIRNSAQFQLISGNGLRKLLEDSAEGESIGTYEDYIRAIKILVITISAF